MSPRARKPWSKVVEEAGVAVRVYERAPGSLLYREVRDGAGAKDRKSLGHRDRAVAETQARALARRVAELRFAGSGGPLSLGQLWALYQLHRLPLLSAARRQAVRAQAALLERHFGRAFLVEDLSQHAVDAYVQARRSGALVAPRHRVAGAGVRAGTIRNELHLLSAIVRWARVFRLNARPLLAGDPMLGVAVPTEKNMRRPVATVERFEKTLAKADEADRTGRLRLLLVLARETGRRVNAILQLRAEDVLLTREAVARALGAAGLDVRAAEHWPHGAIRWSEAADKKGFEAVAPISEAARAAIDAYLRAHPKIGASPIFPAATDGARPATKETAGYWLRRAEELAGVSKLERGQFHPYRRLWASERRHLPAQDVAAAGGWRSLEVMRTAYQHADAATIFGVVEVTHATPRKRRKARPRKAKA
ncbi:MAG: tyrosine-type recombinase/integrase [Gemmatimonadaceae bacterium]